MFTFLWVSNGGGPLRYLSLAFIFLQVILPLWMNASDVRMAADASTGGFDIMPLLIFTGLPLFIGGYLHARPHLISLLTREQIATPNNHVRSTISSLSSALPSIIVMFIGLCLILSWAFLSIVTQEGNSYLSSFLLLIHFLFVLCMFVMFLKLGFNTLFPTTTSETDGRHFSSSWDTSTLSHIVEKIRQFPIEEYISEETVRKSCSISQLKRMLRNRNCYNNDNCWKERSDLVEALEKHRKFNDTCCICAEEYQQGDSLRILPRCLHEFHVECIDQWAYTFASKRKQQQQQQQGTRVEPTCPLCKATLVG